MEENEDIERNLFANETLYQLSYTPDLPLRSGVYYARLEREGKEIKRSLETTGSACCKPSLSRF